MALPPAYYQAQEDAAPIRVIVSNVTPIPSKEWPGRVDLRGTVKVVHRGGEHVRVGDIIEFPVSVIRQGEMMRLGDGPKMWYDDVLNAASVDACLYGTPPELTPANNVVAIVRSRSDDAPN